MRCPSCRQRALSILGWIGHSLWQPVWKRRASHTLCKACGARLMPTTREKVAPYFTSALGIGAGMAVGSAVIGDAYNLLFLVGGMFVGMAVHYPIAEYRLEQAKERPLIPAARVTTPEPRDPTPPGL